MTFNYSWTRLLLNIKDLNENNPLHDAKVILYYKFANFIKIWSNIKISQLKDRERQLLKDKFSVS